MIDIMLGLCDLNLYAFDAESINKKIAPNLGLVFANPRQSDMFNYNMAIANNILGYASQQKFLPSHLNTLIFVASPKPQQLKKEDLLLMDGNLSKVTKVFFSKTQAESWRFKKYELLNYGVPQEHFNVVNSYKERNNKILLLNLNNSGADGIKMLAQLLRNNNISFDVMNELPYDTSMINQIFNSYAICVELNDRNISNLLVSISCGCVGLSYGGNGISEAYQSVPNLYFANTIYDMANLIVSMSQNETIQECGDYFKKNFDFAEFKTKITELISNLNRETFYI